MQFMAYFFHLQDKLYPLDNVYDLHPLELNSSHRIAELYESLISAIVPEMNEERASRQSTSTFTEPAAS